MEPGFREWAFTRCTSSSEIWNKKAKQVEEDMDEASARDAAQGKWKSASSLVLVAPSKEKKKHRLEPYILLLLER